MFSSGSQGSIYSTPCYEYPGMIKVCIVTPATLCSPARYGCLTGSLFGCARYQKFSCRGKAFAGGFAMVSLKCI